ncbi:MAG: hypothetical protein ACLFST_03260 [Spirochaetia bacterium]
MKPVMVFIFLLILPVFILPAQEIEDITYLPPVFYVGDNIEIRITVSTGEGVELQSPEELPDPGWGTINSVRIIKKPYNWEVRIGVTSFVPETQTLPALDLRGMILRNIDVPVASLLDDAEPVLAQPRSQLLLPSTKLYLSLGVGILVGIPLVGIFGFRWIKKKFHDIMAVYRENQPNRRLSKILASLSDTVREDPRQFYIVLLDELRLFMSNKSGVNCTSATTDELSAYVHDFTGDEVLCREIMDVFVKGDLVKFANRRTTLKKRKHHMEVVQSLTAAARTKGGRRNADT